MFRSKLRNKYYAEKSNDAATAYRRQRNKCVTLLRKTKKSYFRNLKPSDINDNKTFWRKVKPLFSDKAVSTNNITLIEDNEIIDDDYRIAEIFKEHFENAVNNLNIEPIMLHLKVYLVMIQ